MAGAQADAIAKAATDKKTEAVKKLTEAQLARIAAERAINEDVNEGGGAFDARQKAREDARAKENEAERAFLGEMRALREEEAVDEEEVITNLLAKRDQLREDARIRDIQGIIDLNAERALLEAEWQSGAIASYEEYAARRANINAAMEESDRMAIQAAGALFGSLASLYEQSSDDYKAFATIEAGISAYLAASRILADPALIGRPFERFALSAAAIVTGLANVKKIQGFEEGGYTGRRRRDNEAVGVVHANEYVVPAPILRTPRGKRLTEELERMRQGHPVRYAPPYIGGGKTGTTYTFTKSTGIAPVGVSSTDVANADLARAMRNMPTPVVRVDDINRVQRAVRVTDQLSSIG